MDVESHSPEMAIVVVAEKEMAFRLECNIKQGEIMTNDTGFKFFCFIKRTNFRKEGYPAFEKSRAFISKETARSIGHIDKENCTIINNQ